VSGATRVVAISGGIGGAKLALGLYRVLSADSLMVGCNTGDDFEHLGLSETWFRLGDADLATHVERTCRLTAGERLSAISDDFCTRLGVRARVVPMSDDIVRTMVHTDDGVLPFQRYFVQSRCEPRVSGFSFHGAGDAHPSLPLWEALLDDSLEAVVICPSNPFISIDPILAVPGLRGAIADCGAPVVAVSPLIGGRAFKGPTAKMMAELGIPQSARAVAEHYEGMLTGFVLDHTDEGTVTDLPCLHTRILMESEEDKTTLAKEVLDFAREIADKVR
jgi:LPPG:FO 2-phospho-L-lactate transferase